MSILYSLPKLQLAVAVALALFPSRFHASDVVASAIPRACEQPDKYRFCDASLPLDERLDDLIHQLDLEEKPFLLTARKSPKGNISRLGIPECK